MIDGRDGMRQSGRRQAELFSAKLQLPRTLRL
jgi:hypothetical protein